MPNPYVIHRLDAILMGLRAGAHGGAAMSGASKGTERELFIELALRNVIAPPFRIGTGDITDVDGARSGQVDTVIEYASSVSLPLVMGMSPRLYLSPGVCAVVEVKSDLKRQWNQVLEKARSVACLRTDTGVTASVGKIPNQVPFFAVGYTGWQTKEKVQERIAETGDNGARIDGILAINREHAIYCGRDPDYSAHTAEGAGALWGFFLSIEQLTSSMMHAKPPYKEFGI